MKPLLSSLTNKVLSRDHFVRVLTQPWYEEKQHGDRTDRSDVAHIIKTCEELREKYRSTTAPDEFSAESVLHMFLIYACFFSSIRMTYQDLRTKTVLCIGANYGMEVILLRSLGIRAYGIESDETLYRKSLVLYKDAKQLFSQQDVFSETIFFLDDILSYVDVAAVRYDLVIGKNLNPLAPVPEMLQTANALLASHGKMLLQWDAVYKEEIATLLYHADDTITYNEELRTLLDALYLYCFGEERPRARFVYLIEK